MPHYPGGGAQNLHKDIQKLAKVSKVVQQSRASLHASEFFRKKSIECKEGVDEKILVI
jgi:hypothetical protein